MTNGIPEYLMKGIKFVGHISKQGKKRMIIIPTRFHERLDNEFKDNDLTVEINLTFEEDEKNE
jgi:hypothetical protein